MSPAARDAPAVLARHGVPPDADAAALLAELAARGWEARVEELEVGGGRLHRVRRAGPGPRAPAARARCRRRRRLQLARPPPVVGGDGGGGAGAGAGGGAGARGVRGHGGDQALAAGPTTSTAAPTAPVDATTMDRWELEGRVSALAAALAAADGSGLGCGFSYAGRKTLVPR